MKLNVRREDLLCSEFAFLRTQVVAVAFPAPVRGLWVSRPAVPANFVMQSDLLGELLLHDISDRHW
jgi:hypothetical protein